MDVLKKIDEMMKERGWSDYRLAQESNLSSSTIANIRKRNTIPSITTLECICDAFGITLAQFFAEDAMLVQLSAEQKTLFDQWVTLTPSQKHLLAQLVKELKRV